ncbi:hypothetical protein GS484_26815 [Rhodococcus hoagii]|nr:hypothetical protein [Prescottella equi]
MTSAGGVIAWGNPDQTAVPIPRRADLHRDRRRYNHSLALTSAGQVISWGSYPGQAAVPGAARGYLHRDRRQLLPFAGTDLLRNSGHLGIPPRQW